MFLLMFWFSLLCLAVWFWCCLTLYLLIL